MQLAKHPAIGSLWQQMCDRVALLCQFSFGCGHFLLAEIANLNTLNNFPIATRTAHWEGIDQPFSDAITTIRVHTHADNAITAYRPIMHMINCSVSRRCRTGSTACFDDSCTALLHCRNKSPVYQSISTNDMASAPPTLARWISGY